jgi:ribonucleotide reductase alpha subunit
MRNVLEGTRLFEVNPLFERISKEKGFYSGRLLEKIAKTGSIQNIKEIPKDIRRIFVTALDIKPEWHVKMQAAFQKHVDNSISKTVNLLQNSSKNDVRKTFELAYSLKCKGITVYRYGCKPQQVLYGPKDLRYEHVTVPPVEQDGVLIKITMNGIGLMGFTTYFGELSMAIDLFNSGTINLNSIISHTFGFSEIGEAFEKLAQGQEDITKAVINFPK